MQPWMARAQIGPDQPGPRVLATTEHDAVWDRQPGEDLYAGQRLTLTQGFAEITTTRGAVAILEAPVTIELLNNDNALRLHLIESAAHMRLLTMGVILLVVLRFSPRGLIPEK